MGENFKTIIFCVFLLQSLLATPSYSSDIVLRLYIEHTKTLELSPYDPDPVEKYSLSQYEHRRTVFAVYRDIEGNFYSSAKDVLWHSTNTQVVDLPTGPSDSINIYGKFYTYHAKITAYSPSIDTTYTTHVLCGFGASNKNNPTIHKNKISVKANHKGCIIRVPQALKSTFTGTIYSIKGRTIRTFRVTKNNTFIPFRHLGNNIYFIELRNKDKSVRKKIIFY